jgi:hypothetical protein
VARRCEAAAASLQALGQIVQLAGDELGQLGGDPFLDVPADRRVEGDEALGELVDRGLRGEAAVKMPFGAGFGQGVPAAGGF